MDVWEPALAPGATTGSPQIPKWDPHKKGIHNRALNLPLLLIVPML